MMSEKDQVEMAPEVEDSPDSTLLMSGEVTHKGRAHQLYLTQTGLRLVAPPVAENSENLTVVDVRWRDVVCAREAPVSRSQSLFSLWRWAVEGPGSEQGRAFAVHYIVKNKDYRLGCHNVVLEATSRGKAEEWIMQIEEKRKEGKPQKLLVVINPIGGKGTARQVFDSKVQPLFALAGMELVIKVTERSKHAMEIAKTFDMSSVDGVAVMGGDGMYMEVLHTVVLRKQEEEGVDVNDPEAKLVPPSVRVGILPAGSRCEVSNWLNGVVDMDTAVLNIVRGEVVRSNIFSLHEPGKLLTYAGLTVSSGFLTEMIKRAEELRWMQRSRYLYVIVAALFGKKKVYTFDVDVLKIEEKSSNKEDENQGGKASARPPGWVNLGRKQLTYMMSFSGHMDMEQEVVDLNLSSPTFDMVIADMSNMETFKFLRSFARRNSEGMKRDFLELVEGIRGFRMTYVDDGSGSQSGSSAEEQAEKAELSKVLNVDGELVTMSTAKFDVRLHSSFLQVFASADYVNKLKKKPKM